MKIHRLLSSALGAGLIASGAHLLAQTHAAAALPCAVDVLQKAAPAGTTITAAKLIEPTGTQPRYCQVDGHVATPGNEVEFPTRTARAVERQVLLRRRRRPRRTIGNLGAGLTRGYASATTDTGHDADDATWISNQAKELDYGHRGTQ